MSKGDLFYGAFVAGIAIALAGIVGGFVGFYIDHMMVVMIGSVVILSGSTLMVFSILWGRHYGCDPTGRP